LIATFIATHTATHCKKYVPLSFHYSPSEAHALQRTATRFATFIATHTSTHCNKYVSLPCHHSPLGTHTLQRTATPIAKSNAMHTAMHTATHTATNVFLFPITTAYNGHTHCSTLQHSLLHLLHRKLQHKLQQIRTFFLSPQPIRDNDLPAALPRARNMSQKKA